MSHTYFKLVSLQRLLALLVNYNVHAENVCPRSPQGRFSATEDSFFSVWPIPQVSSQPGHHCGKCHCPPFYSKQLTSEPPVSTRANAASQEGLHSVAIEKSAGPFGAPWDILDLCMVPADMTHSTDMFTGKPSRALEGISDSTRCLSSGK